MNLLKVVQNRYKYKVGRHRFGQRRFMSAHDSSSAFVTFAASAVMVAGNSSAIDSATEIGRSTLAAWKTVPTVADTDSDWRTGQQKLHGLVAPPMHTCSNTTMHIDSERSRRLLSASESVGYLAMIRS